MNTNDEDYLFGKPTEEVDVPVDRLQQNEADLEIKKIEREEKDGSMSSFGVGFLGISPRYCVWSLFYIFKFYTYIRA